MSTRVEKNHREVYYAVQQFVNAADAFLSGDDQGEVFDMLPSWLSDMKTPSIPSTVLEATGVVDKIENFLKQEMVCRDLPLRVREDLRWISGKWKCGDLNLNDLLRGVCVDLRNPRSKTLDQAWPFCKDWRVFGDNGLMSGETWVNRVAMIRDGAHDKHEGGICGLKDQGAVAIVMSGSSNRDHYADVDLGEIIKYVGTASPEGELTFATRLLLCSSQTANVSGSRGDVSANNISTGLGCAQIEEQACSTLVSPSLTRNPIRVFRSSKLPDINPYKPRGGFRYDGLYVVTSCELLDPARAVWRFTLTRLAGQGEIRKDQPDDQMLALQEATWARLNGRFLTRRH